jgi:hypothetical protein
MGILDRFRLARTPIEDFYYEGYEDGQTYVEERPGLDCIELARTQVQINDITEGLGYGSWECDQYQSGFVDGYQGKEPDLPEEDKPWWKRLLGN